MKFVLFILFFIFLSLIAQSSENRPLLGMTTKSADGRREIRVNEKGDLDFLEDGILLRSKAATIFPLGIHSIKRSVGFIPHSNRAYITHMVTNKNPNAQGLYLFGDFEGGNPLTIHMEGVGYQTNTDFWTAFQFTNDGRFGVYLAPEGKIKIFSVPLFLEKVVKFRNNKWKSPRAGSNKADVDDDDDVVVAKARIAELLPKDILNDLYAILHQSPDYLSAFEEKLEFATVNLENPGTVAKVEFSDFLNWLITDARFQNNDLQLTFSNGRTWTWQCGARL